MKKIIGLLGITALSMVLTYTSNYIGNDREISLDTLISLNKANAEEGSGSDTCYEVLINGTAILERFCLDCRQKRVEDVLDQATC